MLLERTLSSEERIRRAEEIYQRRKMQGGVRVSTSNVNNKKEPAQFLLFKKLALQIVICLLIYFIFYLIQNSNYIFSEDVLRKTREFLSYDINFQSLFNQAGDFYNKYVSGLFNNDKDEINDGNTEKQENIEKTNTESDNSVNGNEETGTQVEKNTINQNAEPGVGGGEEGENLLENQEPKPETKQVSADETQKTVIEEAKPLTQMEIDANEIKANYSFIVPLKGIISSRFGAREATAIVSANHAGIDIAANEGTTFVAAMEGKVTEISTEGGYGNHVYIQNNDVITLYAHCKSIYVKEGETVIQGKTIGEVGQTGNATGPHLHFEIRKQNRLVNPEYILTF